MFDQNKNFKFNPDLSSVLSNHISRYSLVRATAKRAREISEEAEDEGIILVEKPVSIALDEILNKNTKSLSLTRSRIFNIVNYLIITEVQNDCRKSCGRSRGKFCVFL